MLRFLSRGIKTLRGGDRSSFLLGNVARFASTKAGGRLEGKVAIITGGASGLGKATAHEFIQQGARVILADNNSKLGLQTASELGPKAQFIPCDVSEEAQISQVIDDTVAQHGKLDIMYNNAGTPGQVHPPGIDILDLDQFDAVMRVNVRAVVSGIKHAARVMIPNGSGSILCTSSISGLMGGMGPHPYTISKFAVVGVVKSAATELCQHGIRVNCISPSPIPTPMVMGLFGGFYMGASEEQVREVVSRSAGGIKGTVGEEVDVAKAAVYLASDEAKYVTGHNLVVDGGFTSYKTFNLPSPDQIM